MRRRLSKIAQCNAATAASLQPIADFSTDQATVRKVLNRQGPEKFDGESRVPV